MRETLTPAQPEVGTQGIQRPRASHGALPWVLLVTALSSGCALLPKPKPCETPPPLHVVLDAAEQLNPDARGRSLPTVVQLLQLKDSARLERAGFRDLWGRPKEFLGEDLLQVAELTVSPGQVTRRWLQRDPKARVVLAIGLFRQPLGYSWRAVSSLEPVPEPLCVERPAGEQGEPLPTDVQLRYRLQGYQIDLLRRRFGLALPVPPPPLSPPALTPGRSA